LFEDGPVLFDGVSDQHAGQYNKRGKVRPRTAGRLRPGQTGARR
jgi:hypothetical protein